MTKHLNEAFGLPNLDDILKDEGVLPSPQPLTDRIASEEDAKDIVAGIQQRMAQANDLDAKDHSVAMDEIFQETLRHAQNIMDTGFNVDPARAPRWFEVAGGIYKIALDAKNSKMEAKLKQAQLKLNQQKLELDRRNSGEDLGGVVETQGTMLDRNEMVKQLLADRKKNK